MATELATYQRNSELSGSDLNGEEGSISDTFGSFTDYGKAETLMSRTLGNGDLELILTDDIIKETLSGNPKNWHWPQIQLWLSRKKLQIFIPVFDVQDEDNLKRGIEGEEFLDITLEKLFDGSDKYKAGEKLNIDRESAESDPIFERFFRLSLYMSHF